MTSRIENSTVADKWRTGRNTQVPTQIRQVGHCASARSAQESPGGLRQTQAQATLDRSNDGEGL